MGSFEWLAVLGDWWWLVALAIWYPVIGGLLGTYCRRQTGDELEMFICWLFSPFILIVGSVLVVAVYVCWCVLAAISGGLVKFPWAANPRWGLFDETRVVP